MSRRATAAVAGLLAMVALVGCGDSGDGAEQSVGPTLPAPAPTVPLPPVPASADPGTGVFAIGDEQLAMTVDTCSLEAESLSSGLVYHLVVNASAPGGSTLTVTSVEAAQSGGTGSVITETATFRRGAEVDQAQRVAVGGTYHDGNEPAATGRLLVLDGRTVRAGGLFVTSGTAPGTPGKRPGSLIVTCR